MRAFTLANLNSYWAGWVAQAEAAVADRPDDNDDNKVDGDVAAWGVLGVARLHYTLATGDTTSKQGAGRHALNAFPSRWHPLIETCLRTRNRPDGEPAPLPVPTFREALAFVRAVIADANTRYGRVQSA